MARPRKKRLLSSRAFKSGRSDVNEDRQARADLRADILLAARDAVRQHLPANAREKDVDLEVGTLLFRERDATRLAAKVRKATSRARKLRKPPDSR